MAATATPKTQPFIRRAYSKAKTLAGHRAIAMLDLLKRNRVGAVICIEANPIPAVAFW
jgi:hypothetical protein